MTFSLPTDFVPTALASEGEALFVLGGPSMRGRLPSPKRVLRFGADGSFLGEEVSVAFGNRLAVRHGLIAWGDQARFAVRALGSQSDPHLGSTAQSRSLTVAPGAAFAGSRSESDQGEVLRLDALTGKQAVHFCIDGEVGQVVLAGEKIVAAEHGGTNAIYAAPLAGGERERVTASSSPATSGQIAIAAVDDTLLVIDDGTVHAIGLVDGQARVAAKRSEALENVLQTRAFGRTLCVMTGASMSSQGDTTVTSGAALHVIDMNDGVMKTIHACGAPATADVVEFLRIGTVVDVAMVGAAIFALVRDRGVGRIERVDDTRSIQIATNTVHESPSAASAVQGLYEAHLGPTDALQPFSPSLKRLLWEGTLMTGRIGRGKSAPEGACYTATVGLGVGASIARNRGAGYDVVIVHRDPGPWAAAILTALVSIEHQRLAPGTVEKLLAEHGGVTAGPFVVDGASGASAGILLVEGPPLLPPSTLVAGAEVRMLRAITLTLEELRLADRAGIAALRVRIAGRLRESMSELIRT